MRHVSATGGPDILVCKNLNSRGQSSAGAAMAPIVLVNGSGIENLRDEGK